MEQSRLVRCGPRRILRPPLPYVYCRGVAHAAPGVLNDVSNHRVIRGSDSWPVVRRSGRLDPELETEVASVGVKGRPPCSVSIPLTCHPPKIAFPIGFEISKRRPLPKGRSYMTLSDVRC